MLSCPRCIKGTLFYDRQVRDWLCVNCGYRHSARGAELVPVSDGARELNSDSSVALDRKAKAGINGESSSLNKQITELRHKMHEHKNQDRILLELLKEGDLTRDRLDRLCKLWTEHEDNERELVRLCQIKNSRQTALRQKMMHGE